MEKSRPHLTLAYLTTVLPCGLIRLYQLLTMGVMPRCRFSPSCSEYVRQALLENGLWKGCVMGAIRLLKCHPWHPGGYDPISY